MFADFYNNIILKKPKFVFFSLIILLAFFGYSSKDFRLDASSDTLLIEGDPDLEYLREINDRYGAKEFLVLTYAPKEPITSQTTINNLLSLKYKIQSLDWVHNVVTILDIPLLNNSEAPLQERLKNFVTLKDEKVDKDRGFNEIINNSITSKHYSELTPSLKAKKGVNIINPLGQEFSQMRVSMLPSALEVVKYNVNRQSKNLKLFELGKTYQELNESYQEKKYLTILICKLKK